MPFPIRFEEIRKEWRKNLYSEGTWIPDALRPHAIGQSKGIYVTDQQGLYGFLKPTIRTGRENPCAAFEKIASDLAFELNLPVPPVLLLRRSDVDKEVVEHRVCVSLVIYSLSPTWDQVDRMMINDSNIIPFVKTAVAKSSGICAFDLLVGQDDRKTCGNILIGSELGAQEGEAVFIDFANSLNFEGQWENGLWKNVRALKLPNGFRPFFSIDMVRETAKRVRILSSKIIEEIVYRIEDDFLTERNKRVIVEGLNGRRDRVFEYLMSNNF